MKLTKKIEAEITQFLQKYWDTYFEGDLTKWQSFITEDYKNIGTNQEEIWNSKNEILEYTNKVLDQMIGRADVRNKTVQIIPYDPYIMTHELGDLYVKAENKWDYYAPIRLSSLLQKNKNGWVVLHQHGSFPDSKTQEGEAFAFDVLKAENKKLLKAVKERTSELESKNRELKIEGALQRIRAEAVAMKESKDLLDIVVSMRNEFTQLGHQAHYFWHMMWHEDTYEKAMTSGDGTKIGFVMELPRHIHGDIPLLAKWEKSRKPTVVYAMEVEEAIDYVDKMVALGDFKNIDPQAPSHDDIRSIGGLTFIMARTTHGEIGYSLPGVVKNPPKGDIDLLVKFAGAFDLAHQRFLDLQKAEAQARETQIELALEKVRSRTMAMQHSNELAETSFILFEQFKKLGEISDQISIGIIDVENKLIELYSTLKGEQWKDVAKVDLNEPVAMKKIHSGWKKKEKSLVIDLKGNELKKYNNYRKKLSNRTYEEKRWVIHVAFFSKGVLTFSSTEPYPSKTIQLMERFASVFDGTYRRFLDLQKAEQQAREVQIELALEKVRSRSMAMHTTTELQEVINIVHTELLDLKLSIQGGSFITINKDITKELRCWGSGGTANTSEEVIIPYYNKPFYTDLVKKIKQGPGFFTEKFTQKEKKEFFTHLFTYKPWSGLSAKEKKDSLNSEGGYTRSCYVSHHTSIFIINHFGREFSEAENDILIRFGKVFEQTYTRFLDLQKAEAQAREAQIEACLERVRSRGLAMHTSDELEDVIQVVYDQFVQLKINIEHAGFILDYKKNEDMHIWLADQNAVFAQIILPYFDCAHWNSFKKAKKGGQNFFANKLGFEEKNKFYKDLFQFLPDLPEATKETYFQFDGLAISTVLLEDIGLYIENYEGVPFSDEDNDILMRFGTVFQQTYTRFLDLQRAEAQTREAQIEAALERTRTQSMLMTHSDELDATSKVFHEQLQILGIESEFSYVWLPDEAHNEHKFWVAWNSDKKGNKSIHSKAIIYPLDKTEPYTASCFKDWESGKSVHVHHVAPEEVTQFFSAWEELLMDAKNVTPKFFPNGLYYAEAFIKYGCFGINIKRPLSDEEKQILKRFSIEFERTYTRFLDLQKAEAQTREAQIEAAVERVRAESMAMHTTSDFEKVTQQLLKQVQNLELDGFTGASIGLRDENDYFTWWDFSSPGNIGDPISQISRYDAHKYPLLGKELLEELKKGQDYMVFEYDLERLHIAVKEWDKINPGVAAEFKKAIAEGNFTYQWNPCGRLANGLLAFDMVKPPDDDVKNITLKMTHAFEQAYTRFLDLQKSEALARESQIEAALEKIRSRSLAMQKPDELREVVSVVAKKLQELGVIMDANGVIICTYFPDNKDVMHWISSPDGSQTGKYLLPYFDNPIFKDAWESKMSGAEYFSKSFSVKDKNEFFEYAFAETDYKHFPDDFKEWILKNDKHTLSFAWQKNSAILIPSHTGIVPNDSEKDILIRFSKVFEQAYTRYLDLQKAEAQAREAQIEAALERVRSRSMAMHKSEEIGDVAFVLFEQLKSLGGKLWGTGFVFCKEDSEVDEFWFANENGIMPHVKIPNTVDPSHKEMYRGWKKDLDFLAIEKGGVKLKEHYKYMLTVPDVQPIFQGMLDNGIAFPTWQKWHAAYFKYGYLLVITTEEYKNEAIFKRFAKVFEQAYTRFLDLQRAEAQAREAQIEAALEKVRSRTMAMQHSNELPDAANVLFTEVQNLGIPAWSCGYNILSDDKKSSTCIMSSEGEIQSPFVLPLTKHKSLKPWHKAILNNEKFFVYEQGGKDLEQHYEYMQSLPELQETFKQFKDANIALPTFQVNHLAKFTNGFLLFITYERVPEAHDIFKRFGKVFQQTYTRFLDLQKAEAQAQESKIQLSLERVRARAMAMHDSEELDGVLSVLCEQFDVLGIVPMSTHMTVFDFENNTFTFRETGKFGNRSFGEQTVALDAMDNWQETVKKWKADKATAINKLHFPKEQLPEVWKVFHESFASMPEGSRITPKDYPDGIYHTAGKHPFGYIGMNQTRPATEEEEKIVIKFANEFGRAYQRFLDLQKAEAQTREAKIEASLEKVRSVALSLQKSDDMLDIAKVLYEQLLDLGFSKIRNAIIDIHNDEEETFIDYDYSHDMSSAITKFSFYGDPVIEQQIQKVQSGHDAFFEIELKGEQLEELIETRLRNGEKDDPRLRETDHLTYNLYSFGNGAIGISNFGVLSAEQKEVLKRFRNVFTFAYKRYTDLANAEAQAREAKIESALEKVRSVALSMNESTDLLHIAKALYEQLLELGFNDIRNALIDVNNEDAKTFMDYDYSEEMGGTVTLMSYDDDPTLEEQLRVIANTTDGFSEMVLEGQQLQDLIDMRRNNGEADDPRLFNTDSVSYNLYAFGNGAVGISNFGVLNKDEKNILDRFRNVFTFAYQRFRDLQVKEEQSAALLAEKQQLEKTLTDLQQTQKQLIQSEKMASLGELTAGIAHEIQNPLNFVNNFSEVSNELIEEIDEEIAKGDIDEVKLLLSDIKQNLEKINHHGKRADAIVKGMLQHSRKSTAEKVPTDINKLADEYLRLAYHGLRAKDKSFNATLETNFDESIGLINVIPQDMGRVILNLITNAFYATNERKKVSTDKNFKPIVSISTKYDPAPEGGKGRISISVQDNGNGIPKQVVDKIFQPFFTTKPTGEGTGLGLSMSYDIVTKGHGGEFKVKTKIGKGTTFIILIPT